MRYATQDYLSNQVRWPTPRAGNPGSRPNQKSGKILAEKVKKMWITPFGEEKNPGPMGGHLTSQVKQESPGGQLNPDWVCWLMGYPIGWSNIKPLKDVDILDWSIDPADMKTAQPWPTHKAGICGMTAICSDRPREKSTHLTMQVHLRGRSGTGPIPRITIIKTNRNDRLKAIGNAIVPQCAAYILKLANLP